jgi:hypothetical protein
VNLCVFNRATKSETALKIDRVVGDELCDSGTSGNFLSSQMASILGHGPSHLAFSIASS